MRAEYVELSNEITNIGQGYSSIKIKRKDL
jgi:hypothetical protein